MRIYPEGVFPGGCTISFFIDLLLECAEQGTDALAALSVLNEIGLLHFSLPALDRLRALAYQQQRVLLDWDDLGPDIAADEALRQAAHELLTAA